MTEYKLINPDMMLYGGNLEDERKFSMRPMLHKENRTNSALDCPYDGTYCRQKDMKFSTWRDAVAYMATHKVNCVIFTSNESDGCPLPDDTECIRKKRYEQIVQDLKQNEKQR